MCCFETCVQVPGQLVSINSVVTHFIILWYHHINYLFLQETQQRIRELLVAANGNEANTEQGIRHNIFVHLMSN